ncbi:MAG: MBL fold metallo-hydrolase [Coriobacteriales bacterium]|nr:MBL fold metallo-hydrolase [Coriobacteriales bacterium]
MIKINAHSSINIDGYYFDPFEITQETHDAKIIFITHDHYDHFSPKDCIKVANSKTLYVCPKSCVDSLTKEGIDANIITALCPGDTCTIAGLKIDAIHSYNKIKPFHTKGKNWLGYIIEHENSRYYVAGDMDENPDALTVKCDVALIPIGGTYTFDAKKAASFINKIKPKTAIPTHYGSVVGPDVDPQDFAKLVDKDINVEILI